MTLIGIQGDSDTLPVAPDSELGSVPSHVGLPHPTGGPGGSIRASGPMVSGWDFKQRRKTRSGTFFDREDIEQRQPMGLPRDLFRMVPGARVNPSGPLWPRPYGSGADARPGLWVDGMRLVTVEGMDDILPVMDLEAVEVYHGSKPPGSVRSEPLRGHRGLDPEG